MMRDENSEVEKAHPKNSKNEGKRKIFHPSLDILLFN